MECCGGIRPCAARPLLMSTVEAYASAHWVVVDERLAIDDGHARVASTGQGQAAKLTP